MQLNISPENSNQRLDKFLVNKLENLSRSQIQKKIKNTLILVNNKNINPHYFLKAGDVITVTSKQPTVISNKKLLNKIKIIFEDKNYLIIYKPAGLLIHPDNIHNETTLQDYL